MLIYQALATLKALGNAVFAGLALKDLHIGLFANWVKGSRVNFRLRTRIASTTAISLALGLLTFSAEAQPVKSVESTGIRQVAPAFATGTSPKAIDDSFTVDKGTPSTSGDLNVLANDVSTTGAGVLDPATFKLCDPTITASCVAITSFEVLGQGQFTVETTTPSSPIVKFAPCSANSVPVTSCTGEFTGSVSRQRYEIQDSATPTPNTYSAYIYVSVSYTTICNLTTSAFKGIKSKERTISLAPTSPCTFSDTSWTSHDWQYKISLAPDTAATGVQFKNSATPAVTTTLALPTEADLTNTNLTANLTSIKLIAPAVASDKTYKIQIRATDSRNTNLQKADATFTFTYFVPASTPTAPTCKDIATYTVIDTDTAQIDLNQATNPLKLGCTGSNLSFSYIPGTNAAYFNNGNPTISTGKAVFKPQAGWTTPQAWTEESQRARFTYTATDEYGQTGTGKVFIHVAGAVDASCTAPLKNEVLFNTPAGKDAEQFRITNRMLQYIDCAQSGSVITMSWFSLTDLDFVSHLQRAVDRKVEVRFLINSHATQSVSSSYNAWTSLKQVLGTRPAANARNSSNYIGSTGGSWAMYCNAGCLTPLQPPGVVWPNDSEAEYPALHSKFMMISNVGGKRVIAIASSNPTRAQAVNGWNNAQFIIENISKDKLFPELDAYFSRLSAEGCTDQGCPAKRSHPDSYQNLTKIGEASFTTFPRQRIGKSANSDDMFIALTNLLKSGKCIYKDNKGVTQRTQVYVNMFVFTRNSPAMALWRLANNKKVQGGGCDVHVIYTDMDQAMKLNGQWLTKKDGYVNWGALDCLATPGTVKGKYNSMTKTERRPLVDEDGNLILNAKGKKRYTTAQICSRGVLQGSLPTITRGGGLCWYSSKSKVSGGSVDICVSTPLSVTIKDKADNRAKLEPVEDTDGRTRYSHQKYMLIGTWSKSSRQPEYITYSGTPNFSNPGLRWNDEILITSTSDSTYAQYLDNFKDMKRWIKSRPGSSIGSRKCGIYTSC